MCIPETPWCELQTKIGSQSFNITFLIHLLYVVPLAGVWAETHSSVGDLDKLILLDQRLRSKAVFYRKLCSGVYKGVWNTIKLFKKLKCGSKLQNYIHLEVLKVVKWKLLAKWMTFLRKLMCWKDKSYSSGCSFSSVSSGVFIWIWVLLSCRAVVRQKENSTPQLTFVLQKVGLLSDFQLKRSR